MTIIKADPAPWYADSDEVLHLAEWLEDRDVFDSVVACLRYFEKPWKWQTERQQMIGMEADPPTHGECDCGSITDDKHGTLWECNGCRELRESDES